MRGVGAIEALRATLPEGGVAAAAVLTHLGDPAALVALVVAVYWRGRPGGARLLAVGLGAVGLTLALKGVFALPRPPPGLRSVAADGYGFPSGHATGAAAVYGGLALTLELWSVRRRLLAAGAVVAVVAVSRVVLGVHYALDVGVGVLVGTAVLLTVWTLSGERVAPGFWLATALGAAAVALAGTADAALGFGVATGATLAWRTVADAPAAPVPVPAAGVAAAVLGAAVGTLWWLAVWPPLLWLVGVVAGVGIVSFPTVAAGSSTSIYPR